MPYQVAAFYQFTALPDFRELREPLRAICAALELKGSVLLAPEGINGTLAGSAEALGEVIGELRRGSLFGGRLDNLELKFSAASEMPFQRLKIRWALSKARSIPASGASDNSGNLPRAISIPPGIAGSRCSAPAAFAAKRPPAICCRAALPRSITSRAESSNTWKPCRKPTAAGAANVLSLTTASRSATGCGNVQPRAIAMSDVKALSERIDALEARAMFQDETIETLNRTVTAQWLKIDALTRQLASLSDRLQEAENRAPGAAHEPPPHY